MFRMLRRAEGKQQEDYFAPTGILLDDKRAEALSRLAFRLVEDGTSDEVAVEALRQASDGRDDKLLRAATMVRFNGAADDYATAFRANALLVAAGASIEVLHPTPDQTKWFERLASLVDVHVAVGFDRLAELEPRLHALRDELAGLARTPEEAAGMSEVENEALWERILQPLRQLVGPNADHSDPLLRSWQGHDVARRYLAQVAGAHFIDAVDESD